MTRRRFTSWIVAVAVALAASAAARAQTYVNARTDWGAVGDGVTDNYPIVQPRLDAMGNGTRVHFPAGKYMTSRTLTSGANDVWFSGDGPATHLSIYDNFYYQPTLTVGLRTVDLGQAVTTAHRPELNGVMDGTWVNVDGQRYGYRTMGNTVARAVAGPASMGALSSLGGRLFDYWGEATGITVRVCLFLTPTSVAEMRAWGNGAVILGLGDTNNPGPWCFGVDSSSPCNLFFSFRTADQGVDVGAPFRYFRVPMPTSGGRAVPGGVIHDVEVYVSFVDGTYGMRINNAAGTVVNSSLMTGLTGKRFARNRGYQFVIGPNRDAFQFNTSGTVPDFGIYAFNILRTAALAAANTDSSRYAHVSDTVVSSDDPTTPALRLDRIMLLRCGACVPFQGTAARIFHTGANEGGVENNTISDLKITGGIGIGAINHTKITRVTVGNGVQAVEHYNTGTAFPVSVSDSILGGYDCAVDLCQVIATFKSVSIQGMGACAMRFRGCTVTSDGLFVAGFSNGGQCVFDMLPIGANGVYQFRNTQLDLEGYTFTDPDGDGGAAWRVDLHPSVPNTVLTLDGVQADMSGTSNALVLCRGSKGTSTGGTLTMSGLQLGPCAAPLVKFTGPDWKSNVDRRGVAMTGFSGDATSAAAVWYLGESGGGATGPKGDTGATGPQGPAGPRGPAGAGGGPGVKK